jgi:hypothetical protein
MAAIPLPALPGILTNDELVASNPSLLKYEQTNCRDGHPEHQVADLEVKVWAPHDAGFLVAQRWNPAVPAADHRLSWYHK